MNSQEKNNPAVSVVILTYNQKVFLESCINAVLSQEYNPHQIIVVDNGSCDETSDFLRNPNLNITVICNKSNLGFSKAMNKGIEKVTGDYVLLLASDIAIASDCIKTFLECMKNRDDIGLLGGYIYNDSDKRLIFSGKKVSLRFTFKQGSLTDDDGPPETDLVCGGYLFSKSELLKQFKGFDEKFFFYFEDLDLTLRFKKAGFKNLIIPQAKAYHLEGECGIKKYENNERVRFELLKNIMLIYFKHAKIYWLGIFFVRYMIFGLIKNIFKKNIREATVKSRIWVINHLFDLIKARYSF